MAGAQDTMTQWDLADRQALQLELSSAATVTKPLRHAAAALTAMLLALGARYADDQGQIPPQRQAEIRAALDAALAGLAVDVAAETTRAVAAAIALAVRQETRALRALGVDAKSLRLRPDDPLLAQAGASSTRVLAAAISDARRFAASVPLASVAQLEAVAAKAAGIAPRVEANVRFLTNRAINETTRQLAKEATQLVAPPMPPMGRITLPSANTPLALPPGGPPPLEPARAPLIQSSMRLVWIAERDACLTCLALAGHVSDPNSGIGFDEDASFSPHGAPPVWPPGMPLLAPPRHPNCLPGDALVTSSARITGASARIYHGELVEIRTLSQKVFTATPNHPVLTDRGWVPIGALQRGGYIVSTLRREGTLLGDDHYENVPARIQDVAEALLGSGEVASAEVPTSAEDFHGDGGGSKVAVVGSDRLLRHRGDTSLCQHHREMAFQIAGLPLGSLVAERAAQELLLAGPGAAASTIRRSGQSLPFLGAGGLHADHHSLAAVTRLNPGLEQDSTDRRAADSVGFGERLLASPVGVALDQIVEVRRYPFEGHVYNLETDEGWYIGNGIVTHNCRCRLRIITADNTLVPETLRLNAQRSVLRGLSGYDSNRSRMTAARRLLAHGTGLPGAVHERAARDLARGRFTKPRGPLAKRRYPQSR